MKTISSGMASHLDGEVLTLATCWKITRRDGVAMGFCDHDADIVFGGLVYAAASGFTPTAIEANASLGVDNLDIEGMISAADIREEDIAAGKYDFAEVEIFKINYEDAAAGKIILRTGWLGEVTTDGRHFSAEVRGLSQKLAQNIGELYSPSCRASLGDARCKVNLAAHTYSGTVAAVINAEHIKASAFSQPSGSFTGGTITFTSGSNAGTGMEVKEHFYRPGNLAELVLCLPMPYLPGVGDTFSLSRGCDKTLATCRGVFSNVLNFRGEPHVPGLDKMLQTASTRSNW